MKRMKSLFVAAGIIGLVAGGAQIAGHKLDLGGGSNTQHRQDRQDRHRHSRQARAQGPAGAIGLSRERMTTGSTAPPLAAPAAPGACRRRAGL